MSHSTARCVSTDHLEWTVTAEQGPRSSDKGALLLQDRIFDPDHFGDRLRSCLPSSAAVVRLLPTETLYMSGDEDNNVYLIECGLLKTVSLSGLGKECLLGIYARDDLVGESCLLGGERAETTTAMTACMLRQIPRAYFLQLIFENGRVEDCFQYLASKLSEQQQIISHFVTADSEQRLAVTLLRLARKLGNRHDGKLRIDQKITQEELAQIIGTTRSRVGYFLKRFRNQKLIEVTSLAPLLIDEERLGRYVQSWS